MKPQRWLLILAILIVAGSLATRMKSEDTIEPSAELQSAPEATTTEPVIATLAPSPSPSPTSSPAPKAAASVSDVEPTTNDSAPLNKVTPTIEQIRKQAAANPHSPNPSVVNFSVELATRMQDALKSEQSADAFFNELEECSLGKANQSLHSIQSLCLMNASRLAKQYPSLETRLTRLMRDADPRAIEVMNRVQQ